MNNKRTYNFIFVVLCYKNIKDLIEFSSSIGNIDGSYKIVVVNSFSDKNSSDQFEKISRENNFDFIEMPNRGYGAGNNAGVSFAQDRYNFDYIIVSNADIILQSVSYSKLESKYVDCIVAPSIARLDGRNHNPMIARYSKVREKLIYIGMKYKKKAFLYAGILVNKINNIIHSLKHNKKDARKIYAAHGSFMIIGINVLKELKVLFDENMFLFCEEDYLAKKASIKKIDIIFLPDIKVAHKEDGSMALKKSTEIKEYHRQSFLYYYKLFNNKN